MIWLVLLLLWAVPARAATITAISGVYSNVVAAVASANNGDTIVIPPGTNVWNSTLVLNKFLTIQGHSSNDTQIIITVTNPRGADWKDLSKCGIEFAGGGGYNQLYDLHISGAAGATANPAITVFSGTAFRMSRCALDNCAYGIRVAGPFGVIDHCTFQNCRGGAGAFGLGSDGQQNWNLYYPILYSSTNYLFIENCSFEGDGNKLRAYYGDNSIVGSSSGQGASYVCRNNTYLAYNDAQFAPTWDWHGDACDGTRGATSDQIYLNTINILDNSSIGFIAAARGGQSLIYSNTINASPTTQGIGPISLWEEHPCGCPVEGVTVYDVNTNVWFWANTVNGVEVSGWSCDNSTQVGCLTNGCTLITDVHHAAYPGAYLQPYPHPLDVAPPPPNPGVINLSSATGSVVENQGSFIVTLTRTGGADGTVAVDYATTDGTATAGTNYTRVQGTMAWATGDGANKTVTVPIINAATVGSVTFTFGLSNPMGGASLGVNPEVITIVGVGGSTPPSGTPTSLSLFDVHLDNVALLSPVGRLAERGGPSVTGPPPPTQLNQYTTNLPGQVFAAPATYSNSISPYSLTVPNNKLLAGTDTNSNPVALIGIDNTDTIILGDPSITTVSLSGSLLTKNNAAASEVDVNAYWDGASYRFLNNGTAIRTVNSETSFSTNGIAGNIIPHWYDGITYSVSSFGGVATPKIGLGSDTTATTTFNVTGTLSLGVNTNSIADQPYTYLLATSGTVANDLALGSLVDSLGNQDQYVVLGAKFMSGPKANPAYFAQPSGGNFIREWATAANNSALQFGHIPAGPNQNGVLDLQIFHSGGVGIGPAADPGAGSVAVSNNLAAASMTLGGSTITSWPTGGGGGMVGTVSNNIVANGLVAVDGTKTNAIAATPTQVTNALGYSPVNRGGDTMSGSLLVTALTNNALTPSRVMLASATKAASSVATTGVLKGDGTAAALADMTNAFGTFDGNAAHYLNGLGQMGTPPGGGMVGTVSNNIVSNGLLAVDVTKTNAIAATAALVTAALGYTPVNKAGDTLSGPLSVTALTNNSLIPSRVILAGADKSVGSVATTGLLKGDGTAATSSDITNVLGSYSLLSVSEPMPLSPNAVLPGGGAQAYIDTSTSDAKLVFSNTYVGRWQMLCPRDYKTNLQYDLFGNMQTATSGNLVMQARIWAIAAGAAVNMGTENFQTASIVTTAVPGVVRNPFAFTIVVTNTANLAPGQWFMVELACNGVPSTSLFNLSGWTMNYSKQ